MLGIFIPWSFPQKGFTVCKYKATLTGRKAYGLPSADISTIVGEKYEIPNFYGFPFRKNVRFASSVCILLFLFFTTFPYHSFDGKTGGFTEMNHLWKQANFKQCTYVRLNFSISWMETHTPVNLYWMVTVYSNFWIVKLISLLKCNWVFFHHGEYRHMSYVFNLYDWTNARCCISNFVWKIPLIRSCFLHSYTNNSFFFKLNSVCMKKINLSQWMKKSV